MASVDDILGPPPDQVAGPAARPRRLPTVEDVLGALTAGGEPVPQQRPGDRQYSVAPQVTPERESRMDPFRRGVALGLPMSQTPVPVPTEQEFKQGFLDYGEGRLKNIPAQALGFPGDAIALANSVIGTNIPRPPTTTEWGNKMFGEPRSNLEAFGRATGVEGAPIASAITRGVTRGAGKVAEAAAPAMTEAAKAGRAGGQIADTFLANLRHGGANAEQAVQWAKNALQEMYRARSQAYRANMAATRANPTVLPFNSIDDAVNSAKEVGTFQGKTISEGAAKAVKDITAAIDDWKASDPAIFHTAEGLDALKQRVGNIAKDQNILPHTPAGTVIDRVYSAIKDTIIKSDPDYAKAMKDYMEASDELREIERSLSLGRNATKDTSLRKLLSVFRNNANTNYGARGESASALAANDPRLLPALAGQELNSWMPRGMTGNIISAGGIGASVMDPTLIPKALGAMAITSPRVLGEAAFATGNAARLGNALKNTIVPGGGAGVGGIPALSGRDALMLSPQMLNYLLGGSRAPIQQ